VVVGLGGFAMLWVMRRLMAAESLVGVEKGHERRLSDCGDLVYEC